MLTVNNQSPRRGDFLGAIPAVSTNHGGFNTSMKSQHTPGPIVFEGPFPPRESGLLPSVKCTWDGRMIQMFTNDFEQGEIDVRLLCAAPELLNALTIAQATIDRLTVRHGPFSSSDGTMSVIRTAIARAMGTSIAT